MYLKLGVNFTSMWNCKFRTKQIVEAVFQKQQNKKSKHSYATNKIIITLGNIALVIPYTKDLHSKRRQVSESIL